MRRIIEIHDHHCDHDSGCDDRGSLSDLDLIHPHNNGGITCICNGRLLCPTHNRIPQLHNRHDEAVAGLVHRRRNSVLSVRGPGEVDRGCEDVAPADGGRWQRFLDGVGDDQWDLPTPCTEWDVRALVNHVVGEERWTGPLLDGMTIAEVGDRFDGDLLGDDPRRPAGAARRRRSRPSTSKLAGIDSVHLSYGDEDPAEYVRQLSADHLIHGWDLAAATGQDRTLDAELVAEVARGSPTARSCTARPASSARVPRLVAIRSQTCLAPRPYTDWSAG